MAVVWVVVALLFAIAEVASFAFYAAFLALGALTAAVTAALGASIVVQAVVFLGIAVLGIGLIRPFATRMRGPKLVSGAGSMIGQEVIIVQPILGPHQPGHLTIAGESWLAESIDGSPVPGGATVKIIEIRGVTLLVQQ